MSRLTSLRVTLHESAHLTSAALREWSKQQLAPYKAPTMQKHMRFHGLQFDRPARRNCPEPTEQTLQATALVHEAYLRLADSESE